MPLQIVPECEAAISTFGVTLELTDSVMPALVTAFTVWQALFAVMVQVITSPFAGA